jgi:hypothetical protein
MISRTIHNPEFLDQIACRLELPEGRTDSNCWLGMMRAVEAVEQ